MMHAITIWQPWATLILEGIKPFEFRSWPAPKRFVGQRIAIHAGARPVKPAEVREMLARLDADGAHGQALDVPRATDLLESWLRGGVRLPLSSVLCTAILGEPLSPAKVKAKLGNDSDREDHFNWAWPLTEIEPLRPFVPARGAQGFWPWTGSDA